MKTLTVFTCTYNRAHTIGRTYKSLCQQSSNDFCWLIVDDGSTDNTKELVDNWINNHENNFEIIYTYKENGGLHTGYNKAIEIIDTELCVGIDSDDAMPDDAVEKIVNFWKENSNKKYAGIIALDYLMNGDGPIGGFLPDQKEIRLIDINTMKLHKGDTKQVHRSEILKQYDPIPVFEGEKDSNPAHLFLRVDADYPLLVMNEGICLVEYQLEGMTKNIFYQYRRSPKSYMAVRKLWMSLDNIPLKYKFKQAIHYISSSIFSKNKLWLDESPRKLMTIAAIPFGVALNLYVRYKTK